MIMIIIIDKDQKKLHNGLTKGDKEKRPLLPRKHFLLTSIPCPP